MRAQEITTASGQDILDYVKSIHHDFRLDSEILDHPQWRLSHVPLGQLHIPDPESGEDESDPYDRVQWMDMAHVDDIKQRDIDNKPIVIDTNGYILDGNHRALAARLSGRQTIPAWVPVPDLDESVLRLKQDQQAQQFIDRVYELYPQTWQNNHVMTWGEGDEQELAMFELVPNPARPRTVEVKWFQAYPLRRGIGSRAMRELQRLAQEAGVDLSLYVWDKGQVSAAKLARFYRAQGFRPTAKGSRSMTWSPVNETVPGLKFLRPGELRGSYTNAQLQALGFRQARNGAWFIPQRRWQELTQSGQLREQQLQERVSSTIYHYTNILAGLQAVKSGQFELSSVLGSEWEQQFAPRGYPYFFSATRTRTGGYHDYVGDTAVMFVLDGDWFNSRYPGGSVDYWGNRDPKQSSHRAHEAEDRIFSRERSIPTGGVRAVHVLAKPDADPQHRAWARQLIIAAKQQNLPVYLYNDAGAWRALDTRKTVKPNYLTGQDAARGRGTRGHRGYLMPWMELIWGRDRSSLSKRAQSVLYALNYQYDRSESVKSLGVDLSNARKPSSGPDRENAVKIISYMRKNRLADLAALADHVRDRWKSLEPVREELIRTDRLQENTVAEGRENFNGINILFQHDDDEVFVKASAGGRELGHVLFVNDGEYLIPQDLEVEERFRGQGIAQTMYDFVKSKGYKIRRSGQQTDAGAGFWAKHRPEQNVWEQDVAENFADGKKPGRAVVRAILGVLPTAQEIWFHGSRAIGKHRPDSDTDILVIVPGQFDAEEYFNAVRTLQSLNEKFHNYDIQPSKPGSNIHRIAQEEGKLLWRATNENFADGKKPGRRGLSKRMGVPTKASVSKLRKIARSSSGEKQRMAHWLANMKSGRKKSRS